MLLEHMAASGHQLMIPEHMTASGDQLMIPEHMTASRDQLMHMAELSNKFPFYITKKFSFRFYQKSINFGS